MKEFSKLLILFLLVSSFSNNAIANSVYGPFPITLQGYTGDKTNSVKYTGQMARHILHDSLKSIVKTGDVEKMQPFKAIEIVTIV